MMICLLICSFLVINCDDVAMTERIESVYDETVERMEEESGWNRLDAKLTVAYPSGSHATYNYSYNHILQAITRERISLPVSWKDWELRHEIGHSVMTALYNWRHDYLPQGCDYDRDMYKKVDEECALNEGWAIFFHALTADGKSTYLRRWRGYTSKVPVDVAATLYKANNTPWLFDYIDEEHLKSVRDIIATDKTYFRWGRIR